MTEEEARRAQIDAALNIEIREAEAAVEAAKKEAEEAAKEEALEATEAQIMDAIGTAPIDAPTQRTRALRWPARPVPAVDFLATEAPPVRPLFQYIPKEGETPKPAVPAGKVGLVIGTGGAGKTTWLMRLAMAYAGGFAIDGKRPAAPCGGPAFSGGGVLYVCGEEALEELHVRARSALQSLRAGKDVRTATHINIRDRIGANLHFVSLSGIDATLVVDDGRGEGLSPTDRLAWVRVYAAQINARLIIIDPLARFAGPAAETDNAAATAVVRALEALTYGYGDDGKAGQGPTVLAAHHVAKGRAHGLSTAESQELQRGSSALTDGARWQLNLVAGSNASASAKDKDAKQYERTWSDLLATDAEAAQGEALDVALRRAEGLKVDGDLTPIQLLEARVVRAFVAKYNAGPAGDWALYAQYGGQLFAVRTIDGDLATLRSVAALRKETKATPRADAVRKARGAR